MALLGRQAIWTSNPIKNRGGLSLGLMRENFSGSGFVKNQYAGGYSNFNATPRGYLPPYSWILPIKDGGLSTSAERMAAELTEGTNALGSGLPMSAAMSGSITITDAALGLIVSLQAALTASLTITDAELAATLNMVTSMSASGQITDATLGAIVSIISSMSAAGTLNATALVGVFMEWSVGGPEELSSQGLAIAVWNYLKENETVDGSMKEELQKAKTAAENAFAVSS